MNLEIERRFILKNFDFEKHEDKIYETHVIKQIYLKEKENVVRYRMQATFSKDVKFFKTIKNEISKGIVEEIESEITSEVFFEKINNYRENEFNNIKEIHKRRYVIKDDLQNIKFEIDLFHGITLIIMEIELPSIDYNFTIPDFLQENILLEVTGLKQFSNYSLASELKFF